jgi:hypothetical protein
MEPSATESSPSPSSPPANMESGAGAGASAADAGESSSPELSCVPHPELDFRPPKLVRQTAFTLLPIYKMNNKHEVDIKRTVQAVWDCSSQYSRNLASRLSVLKQQRHRLDRQIMTEEEELRSSILRTFRDLEGCIDGIMKHLPAYSTHAHLIDRVDLWHDPESTDTRSEGTSTATDEPVDDAASVEAGQRPFNSETLLSNLASEAE